MVSRENLGSSDLVVVAGDNLFSESLEEFAKAARTHPAAIATYDVGDLEAIKKYNNIGTDAEGRPVERTLQAEVQANKTTTVTFEARPSPRD